MATLPSPSDVRHGSIYALYDPREPDHYRYVGKTTGTLESRLRGHAAWARRDTRSWRACWFNHVIGEGFRPEILLIEEGSWSLDELNFRERYWIAKMRDDGHRLTNATDGGDGGYTMNPEARARHIAVLQSPEFKAKLAASRTPEVRQQLSDSIRRWWSERPEMVESFVTRMQSSEVRQRHLEVMQSSETREKVAAASKQRWKDPVYRAALVESVKAAQTDELLERKSKTMRAHWLDPDGRKQRLLAAKKSYANGSRPKYRCDDCDFVSFPGPLGVHQKARAHAGRTLEE